MGLLHEQVKMKYCMNGSVIQKSPRLEGYILSLDKSIGNPSAGAHTDNQTFTFPVTTGNDTIVTAAATQTLTGKTLTAPVISSITNSGTLTLPTGSDTLVARNTTDTLQSKTINTDNDTIKHSTTNTAGDLLVNTG
jgi:hypothetical protein